MRKYLNKSTLIIKKTLPLTLFGIVVLFSSSLAQTKLEYYKRLFSREFGLTVYEVSEELLTERDYLLSDPNKGYLILLSSEIFRKEIKRDYLEQGVDRFFEEGKKTILICDVPYSARGSYIFTCDKSDVYSDSITNIKGFLRITDQKNTDIYIMPEDLLVSIDGKASVEDYFKALSRSKDTSLSFEDTEAANWSKIQMDKISDLLKTTTFETFKIAISISLIVVIFYIFLKFLSIKDKRGLAYLDLNKFLICIGNFFVSTRWFVAYILLFIFSMYIPLVVALGVKDGKGVSLVYFISYSLDAFNITNLMEYINQGSYFRLLVFFYNLVFLIVLVVFSIPSLIKMILKVSTRIGKARLKPEMIKYSTPIIMLITILSSSFANIADSYNFLIFCIVVLFYIVINNSKYKIFNYKYSKRERVIFISIAVLIVCIGFLFRVRKNASGPEYKEESLIGVSDPFVMLPYSKQLGDGFLIKDFLISKPNPIFVDQYLIYSSDYPRVENKNAVEFEDEGYFYIQNSDLKDIIQATYVNKELSDVLISKVPTNLFEFRFMSERPIDRNINIEVAFSCKKQDIGTSEVESEIYYPSKDGGIQKVEKTLLYFPGCSKVGESEAFTVEFDTSYIDSEYFFMKLPDILGSDIKSIRILTPEFTIMPTYYVNLEGYGLLISNEKRIFSEEKITNYIFGESYDLSFDLNLDDEGRFNIAQPINELIKVGVLKDKFLIWSTVKYVLIREE
ncbi:hypothetical protein ACFLZ4_01325 [Patescibacteria group bacterium]